MRIALLFALTLSFVACKKNENKTENKPATGETAPKAAGDTQAVAAATTTTVTIKDQADYEAKGTAFMDKLMGIFSAAGTNCDKAAADIQKYFNDEGGKATVAAIKEFEKANPDAEKAMEAKMEGRMKEFEAKLGPTMEACQEHEGLKSAMSHLDSL
jgi:hypothetical protein